MSSPSTDFLTPAEYLEIERKAEIRHEYIGGRMYSMSGGSPAHVRIAMNLGREISGQLLGRPCDAFGSDMRVKIPASNMYTYPDLSIVCDAQFEVDTLLNPAVIVEILSESTEAYDRGEKFRQYQTIESLHEYVLVSQKAMRVEYYVRTADGHWVYSALSQPEERLQLVSVGCELRLADIYVKVEFNT